MYCCPAKNPLASVVSCDLLEPPFSAEPDGVVYPILTALTTPWLFLLGQNWKTASADTFLFQIPQESPNMPL